MQTASSQPGWEPTFGDSWSVQTDALAADENTAGHVE